MEPPITDTRRPHMPGYGTKPASEGTGLLPWSWAAERLTKSHDYWIATVWPDGRPHVMPVWGVWRGDSLWFSSGLRSRKAKNLAADERCVATTDNALEPVVVEGRATPIREPGELRSFTDAVNAKYDAGLSLEFFDPDVNGTFRLRPTWVFALTEDDFEGSPTRWTFAG
jgi:nitroimidazol reductase NimA-like FMN-containing flavoprotein (pyridoxamine 5'-phosphate oxidase superfamily)